MNFFILVLIFCFLIFLFTLYLVSHDDFVLLRKDISQTTLFDTTFIMIPFSFLLSRLFYAFSHPSGNYLNPLYFLLFPYFPGLSLLGAIIGAGGFLFLYFKAKRLPFERLLDLFALSLLPCFPFGILGYFILSGYNLISAEVIFTTFSYIFLFAFFSFYLFPKFLKGRFKEGNMSILFVMALSFISLVSRLLSGKFSFGFEEIIFILLLSSSIGIIINREEFLDKVLSFRK